MRGLILECLKKAAELVMTASVDASYLTYQDSRSQTSFSLKFGASGSYYSKSVKQATVAISSTQAETIAMAKLIKDTIYAEGICGEIGRPIVLPDHVLEDNDASITLMTR